MSVFVSPKTHDIIEFHALVCLSLARPSAYRGVFVLRGLAMTRKDGLPCKKCGTSEWYNNSHCKECSRIYNYQWQQANPEKHRESSRRWILNNPERSRDSVRQWQKANPEKVTAKENRRRTRETQAGGSYTAAEFKALCKQYNGRCACCGKKAKLTADHVIPVSVGGSSDISNIQGLCKSCNSSKGTKTVDYRTKPSIMRWIQEKLL